MCVCKCIMSALCIMKIKVHAMEDLCMYVIAYECEFNVYIYLHTNTHAHTHTHTNAHTHTHTLTSIPKTPELYLAASPKSHSHVRSIFSRIIYIYITKNSGSPSTVVPCSTNRGALQRSGRRRGGGILTSKDSVCLLYIILLHI
jgi:hypothetical protein